MAGAANLYEKLLEPILSENQIDLVPTGSEDVFLLKFVDESHQVFSTGSDRDIRQRLTKTSGRTYTSSFVDTIANARRLEHLIAVSIADAPIQRSDVDHKMPCVLNQTAMSCHVHRHPFLAFTKSLGG